MKLSVASWSIDMINDRECRMYASRYVYKAPQLCENFMRLNCYACAPLRFFDLRYARIALPIALV